MDQDVDGELFKNRLRWVHALGDMEGFWRMEKEGSVRPQNGRKACVAVDALFGQKSLTPVAISWPRQFWHLCPNSAPAGLAPGFYD